MIKILVFVCFLVGTVVGNDSTPVMFMNRRNLNGSEVPMEELTNRKVVVNIIKRFDSGNGNGKVKADNRVGREKAISFEDRYPNVHEGNMAYNLNSTSSKKEMGISFEDRYPNVHEGDMNYHPNSTVHPIKRAAATFEDRYPDAHDNQIGMGHHIENRTISDYTISPPSEDVDKRYTNEQMADIGLGKDDDEEEDKRDVEENGSYIVFGVNEPDNATEGPHGKVSFEERFPDAHDHNIGIGHMKRDANQSRISFDDRYPDVNHGSGVKRGFEDRYPDNPRKPGKQGQNAH